MNTVGITRVSDTDEYRVFWRDERGKDDEAKAYYTDDPEDAVDTLIDTIERAQAAGIDVKLADTQQTKIPVAKYRWLWLQNTLKSKNTTRVEEPEGKYSSPEAKNQRRKVAEDIQDKLFMAHPEKFETLYQHLTGATGKEPSPAMMVNRFKDEYPELYQSTVR